MLLARVAENLACSFRDPNTDKSTDVEEGCEDAKVADAASIDEKKRWWRKLSLNRDAVHFGTRMAVTLTVSSVFALVQSYPQGLWVYISVLFVSWFPSLDAASVIEKSLQRLMGTIIGALLGLICGFLSLAMPHGAPQAIFLACCIGVVTFGITFSTIQFRVGRTPIIQRYNYASILCLLTFGICILPFYVAEKSQWRKSVYRIANVLVGCLIGAFGSVVVLPRSTASILRKRIDRQITLAGEASEAVLHGAADVFSGKLRPLPLAAELRESRQHRVARLRRMRSRKSFRAVNINVVDEEGNLALEKYESAIQDWKESKKVFPLLHYDPFNFGVPPALMSALHAESANTLARALRIQTTVVLLDGIVRNDTKHDFDEDQLTLFADSGTLVRRMLTVPFNRETSEAAAEELSEKLVEIRYCIIQLSAAVGRSKNQMPTFNDPSVPLSRPASSTSISSMVRVSSASSISGMDDVGGRGMPKHVPGSRVCALLFVQLVEHLTLRSLRLYHAWKECQRHCEILDSL